MLGEAVGNVRMLQENRGDLRTALRHGRAQNVGQLPRV